MTIARESPEERFKALRLTNTFLDTLKSFEELRNSLSINENDDIYSEFKTKLQSPEVQPLWACLKKRESHKEYYSDSGEKACKGKKVLIVGAGPCGLRMAIECAFLGAHVTIIDMREYISRNNVLHLWPFVKQDIKLLGGKVFNPKFCVGPIDHVSIKRLQLLLLKISLMMGVKVYTPVKFQSIIDPSTDRGWHVSVSPEDHCVNNIDFDFIIGANGKNNSLPDFKRKTTRGKLAIAITANFVNRQSTADAKVQEIGGLSFIFDQEFFNGLKEKTRADLENLVYYKDDTHYFVMTPKKACLLETGVIKQDSLDCKKLLSAENIDPERLRAFARDVAKASTYDKLPSTDFEQNHYKKDDLAIFDFTSISMANNSCFAKEKHGKVLMQCIVGDSLLEPFWPTGTGCARGFLSVFDCAWLLRSWSMDDLEHFSKLHVIAERESIFRILSQTEPEGQMKKINKYTIDPVTRYGTRIKTKTMMTPKQVNHLYVHDTSNTSSYKIPAQTKPAPSVNTPNTVQTDRSDVVMKLPSSNKRITPNFVRRAPEDLIDNLPVVQAASKRAEVKVFDRKEEEMEHELTITRKRNQGTLNFKHLLTFYQRTLKQFSDIVTVFDLSTSWQDGTALCALLQAYRPSLINVYQMPRDNIATTLQVAFVVIEEEFGVSPLFSAEDVAEKGEVDKLAMLTYLAQIHQALENEPVAKMPKLDTVPLQNQVPVDIQHEEEDPFLEKKPATPQSPRLRLPSEEALRSSISPHGMLVKMSTHTALQDLYSSVEKAKAFMDDEMVQQEGDVNKEAIRDTFIKSNLMQRTTPKQGGLRRKRAVAFKETPPCVIKYRESQDIHIGQNDVATPARRGILASGAYDNNTMDLKEQLNQSHDTDKSGGHKSLLLCETGGGVKARIAKFDVPSAVANNQPPKIRRNFKVIKTASPSLKPGRPSLAYCRGITGARIKSWQPQSSPTPKPVISNQSPTVIKKQLVIKEEKIVNTPVISSKSKPHGRYSSSADNVDTSSKAISVDKSSDAKSRGNFFGKLKGLVTRKDQEDYSIPENREAENFTPQTDLPNYPPRRGLQQVPNKALESMSYVACSDRNKPDLNVFRQDKFETAGSKKQSRHQEGNRDGKYVPHNRKEPTDPQITTTFDLHLNEKNAPQPPPASRRGLDNIPNKALQSMSYVAALDRKKTDISVFQKEEKASGLNKKQQVGQSINIDVDSGLQSTLFTIIPEENKTVPEDSAMVTSTEPQHNTVGVVLRQIFDDHSKSNKSLTSEGSRFVPVVPHNEISATERVNAWVASCEPVSSVCCVCEQRLYLVERHSAHGNFFHKGCYRCHTCNTMLRHGNSVLRNTADNKAQFFCFSHAYTAGVFNVEWEGQHQHGESDTEIVKSASKAPSDSHDGLNLNLSENVQEESQDYTSSEEESSDEEDEDVYLPTRSEVKRTLQYHKSMRSQRSLRLLVADEIQRGLQEVDDDEEKLQKEGHDVEERLRKTGSDGADETEMEKWLEVLRKKKELVDKESKLMLKKKLVDLQDKYNRLQLNLSSMGTLANTDQGVQEEMKVLENDTATLEKEIGFLVLDMSSLSTFLDSDTTV